MMKIGVNLRNGIEEIEERFMSGEEKDFLLMILDSMKNGQKV